MFQRHPIQNDAMMFVTTNTQNRRRIFAQPAHAREALDTLYRTQELHPFLLYGFVIMPDHCHFLLKPLSPVKISTIMRTYKYGTSTNIGLGPIWQSRFHLKIVEDVITVLHYIHANPVRANLVESPEQYPWSSACGKWEVSEWGCL